MNRVWRNFLLYFLVAQPITFLAVWIVSESEGTAAAAFRRFWFDLGAYLGLFAGAFWTILVIPAAFLTDKLTRRWSPIRRMPALVLVCACTGYLSTLLFAYGLALFPMVIAFILGCAAYGAAFRLSPGNQATA